MNRISKLFTLVIFMSVFINSTVYASVDTVKIGLEANFKNKSTIKIDNQYIRLNFGATGGELTSSGFTATAKSKNYLISNNSFGSFSEANHEAAMLNFNNPSINARPIYIDNNFYVVFGEGNSEGESNAYRESYPNCSNIRIDNGVEIFGDASNSVLIVSPSAFSLTDGNNGNLSLEGKAYRGSLTFSVSGNVMTAINIINSEEYLYSVLPSEMPASWHIEALKAQAISARSYLYTNASKHSASGYGLCDGVHCQVYSGVRTEHANSSRAVNETKGQAAYYDNKIISAFFFSSSGGITDNSENSWSSPTPYLKSVIEVNEPNAEVWTRTFTMQEINQLLINTNANIGTATGVSISDIRNERVYELTIYGTNGTKKITGESIRTFFATSKDGSLKSRYFRINEEVPAINGSASVGNSQQNNIPQPQEPFIDDNVFIQSRTGVHQVNKNELFAHTNGGVIKLGSTLGVIGAGGAQNNINATQSQAPNNNNVYSNSTYTPSTNALNTIHTSTITINGRGWGHGIGLSQFGAKGMAEQGYSYEQIIKHYYQGATVQ